MKKTIIFLAFSVLLILSIRCSKESYNIPVRHESKEIDLNKDLINDVRIQYAVMTWDGIGPDGTGDMITGEASPINNTKILIKQDQGSLFEALKDTLYLNMNTTYSWESAPATIVKIKTYINKWPKEWSIASGKTLDYYYLAFLKSSDIKKQLGWLKISIDKTTGIVNIHDNFITDNDQMVIGKKE